MNLNHVALDPVQAAWTYSCHLAQHDPPLLKTNYYYTSRAPKLRIDDDAKPALSPSHATAWDVAANPGDMEAMLRQSLATAEVSDHPGAHQTTVIHSDFLRFLDNWVHALHLDLSTVVKCIEPSDRLELSHLSIDSLHDASSLAPITRHDAGIATLVVLLQPKDASQLNLDFVQDGVTVPWREADTHPVHYALVPTGMSLVTSPTTAQGASPRVALVFHVVRSIVHTERCLGMISRVVLYLEKLAASSALGNRSGIQVPDSEKHPVLHRSFFGALVVSNCYDVGLAEYSQETGIQSLKMLVQSSPVNQSDFLNVVLDKYVVTNDREQPHGVVDVVLVFWRKQHLVNGIKTTEFATMMRLMALAAGHDGRWRDDHEEMLQLRQDLCDRNAINRFVRRWVDLDPSCPLTRLAPWLHSVLSQYSWESLFDALNHLVSHWCSNNRVEWAASLVASLAGVSDARVCAPLAQPFTRKCFWDLWSHVHTGLVHPGPLEARHEVEVQRLIADTTFNRRSDNDDQEVSSDQDEVDHEDDHVDEDDQEDLASRHQIGCCGYNP